MTDKAFYVTHRVRACEGEAAAQVVLEHFVAAEKEKAVLQERERSTQTLEALKIAFRKHHLNDDSIGWEELGDIMWDALCEAMGDAGFQEWLGKTK